MAVAFRIAARRALLAAVVLGTGLAAAGCGGGSSAARRGDVYLYEDTRRLVAFVDRAAELVERRGAAAFQEFGEPDSPWRRSPTYLFVYDLDGVCLWHGLNPELVGHNLIAFHDAMGKPVIEYVVEIGKRPERESSGWVFYFWEEQTDFIPTWKSSYVRKAVGPDGKVYLVGSGSSRQKVEKVFVREQVEAATRLLERHGKEAAFADLKAPGSRFHYLGNFVYVLDGKGRSLVDPSYPTLKGRDMSGFRDAVGRPVMKDLLSKLETADEAWVQFLWPRPGERLPSRRLMFVKKVNVAGETLLVGSDFFLATPIWMKL